MALLQTPDYEDLLRRITRLERLPQRLDDLEQDIGRSGVSSIGHAQVHSDSDHLPPLLKTADQIVNNSTTLVAITDFGLQVGINETWAFEMFLICFSTTVADILFGWSYPAGTTIRSFTPYWTAAGAVTITTTYIETGTLPTAGFGAVESTFWLRGVIYTGATPGVVSPTFAQNTAEVSDTTIKAGSILLPRRII